MAMGAETVTLLIGLALLALAALTFAGLVAAIGPDSPRSGTTIDTRAPVIRAHRIPDPTNPDKRTDEDILDDLIRKDGPPRRQQ